MTDPAADVYRRALRWYPPAWREGNAENVVSTFLDRDDATGTTGPTRRDRAGLARAGLGEYLSSSIRSGRRSTTAIGLVFLLAAWSYGSVVLEVGGRAMTMASGGFVDTMGRSYVFPVLVAAVLVALAWLSAAIAVSRRGHPFLAATIGFCGVGNAWTMYHLAWSSLVPPLDLGTPLVARAVLSTTALTLPLLAAVAAVHAGLLQQRAHWFIATGAAAQVAGSLVLLDRPSTVSAVLLVMGSALLTPVALVITGATFAFLSTSTTHPPRTSRARRHAEPSTSTGESATRPAAGASGR